MNPAMEYRAEYGGLYVTAPDQAGIDQEIGWLFEHGAKLEDINVTVQVTQ